jgi:hypothetical protein
VKPFAILFIIIALILFVFACAVADGAPLGMSALFWVAAGLLSVTVAFLLERIP